ncbi:hypothetical protein ACH5RR_029234 [Cinchona calisaya]|uniref:Reverse transcriptase n=1 Tax=Cinchona calisaya TaxID=153742 RepID=A0ABD2YR54_9GENT
MAEYSGTSHQDRLAKDDFNSSIHSVAFKNLAIPEALTLGKFLQSYQLGLGWKINPAKSSLIYLLIARIPKDRFPA